MEIKLDTPIECTMQQAYSARNTLRGLVAVRMDWENKKFYVKLWQRSAERELKQILNS